MAVYFLESQNSAPLSDTDHIHRLLQKVVNSTLRSESTDITFQSTTSLEYLEELRDYLHEMDNAVDFGKMGGLSIMLQLVLDYSFIEVRTSAVWTIGLACQNNPELIGLAHGISTVQNMLYLLKSSGPTHDDTGYPKIDLMDIESVNLLSKLIWTLSSLTRQNEESYAILKEHNGADVLYDWIMEIYSFWNLHRDDPRLLSDLYKNKMVEKVLMFASDVVVLNPEQRLFVNDNWCNVFAAHFNYAQHLWREITLAYWDIAVRKLFCVNCIPFGNGKGPRSVPHQALSIDIGLNKLKNMKIEDDFDLEIRNKAIRLLHIIDSQA